MAVKQKKRRWPDDEKRSICFQTTAAGVSVAQVARRYAMNANLIFKWLKDDRYAPAVDVVPIGGQHAMPIDMFGRAIRPARSTTRGSEAEIAWKVAFGCFSLTGGKPNGECRVK